jgi:chromosome segregation ATPase
LQASIEAEGDLELKVSTLEQEIKGAREKAVLDLKANQQEVKALKDQIAVLKDSTKVGEKQRALEALQAETHGNNKLIEDLQVALETAVSERALLAEKLLDLEHSIEQRVVERIATERTRTKELEATIESLKRHHEENLEHYQHLEDEKAQLVRDVDELSNWKAVYEAGNGLQEMARNQKKLKDDNRRLGVAVEQYNNKLSMVMDANGVLTQAFERLKREAGKPADFFYPEYSLQNEVLSANASLQSQLQELEEQVVSLEHENTRIRSAMKNQAASIGEQGFKYAGMTPDMLLQVNDFAANLREGKLELPLNDRSQALLKENRSLKADMETLKLRLERYERELGGAVFTPGAGAAPGPSGSHKAGEGSALQGDMQRLADENSALHAKMNALQSDLSQLLMRPTSVQITAGGTTGTAGSTGAGATSTTGTGMISANELSNILLQNNQMMMQQMESLRRSTQPISYAPQQSAHFADSNVQRSAPPMASTGGRSGPVAAAMDRAQVAYKNGPGYAQSAATPAAGNTVSFAGVPSTPGAAPSANRTGGVGVAGVPNTPMWTPAMGRGGMPFVSTAPYAAGPATPHGKQLLSNTLNQLNLPPEEWALDVRDLNSQLVECLEQLYQREQELEDTNAVVSTLEENLVGIKQQMTALYYDFAQRADTWEQREAVLKKEHVALNEERDDLRLKLRRMQDMAELLQREDKESIGLQLTDLTRKVTIYEVNEAVLSRKYIAQSEQLQQEQIARQHLESDFVEMETSLKKRILYLEQYKLAAGARIGHLQGRVDSSVPQADYVALQSEIDVLREDHLNTLRREVEARMASLKALDHARELRSTRIIIAHMQADLESARAAKASCEAELVHQREVTNRALAAAHSSAEVSQLVSELARFRGEASRLEVELMASNRRSELIGERVQDVSREADQSAARVHELERREDELSVKESAARKSALDMQLKYEGGLTRELAEELRAKLDKRERELEEARREVLRHKELAEIASHQAQALSSFRKDNETELHELREYCTRLESRSDDELLIGRLQRKLMSTTTSYKAFTRKYHQAREAMRKRELGMRILENRLDEKDQAVMKAQEVNRLEVSALKKALINLKNTVFESKEPGKDAAAAIAGQDKMSAKNGSGKNAKSKKIKTLARSGFATVTVGAKLVDVSVKVDALAVQAEEAVNRAAECEEECRELKGRVEDLLAEKFILEQRTTDLEALTKGKAKQQAIASRLIAYSDDVRSNKIAYLQQRRQVQVLRQEKRHLQSIISNIEADVMELEEGKVLAETKHILFDINEKTGLNPAEEEEEFASALRSLAGTGPEKTESSKATSSKKAQPMTGVTSDFPQRKPDVPADSEMRLSLDMDLIQSETTNEITAEELYEKLQAAHAELAATRRELSDHKLKAGALMGQVADMEALIGERDGQVSYYERVLTEEGLPAVLLRNQPQQRRGQAPQAPGSGRQYRMLHDEQEKLQEAACATIGSLRALLEEKNRTIDKLRHKLEHMQTAHPTKSRAEIRADELLSRIAADETEEARARRYGAVLHPEVFSGGIGHASEAERQHHNHLLGQIEQADSIIAEKDRTLAQLEQKLMAENNQRERAEVRCGESIKEMEAMKEDMITLVQQLQESQARCAHLSKTSNTRTVVPPAADGSSARVKELERSVKAKTEKLKEYRTFIVNLKDEFMKSEQKAVDARPRPKEAVDQMHSSSIAANAEEIRGLRQRVADMQDAIKGAKQDLEHARKHQQHLKAEREQAEERAKQLEAAASKAESQMQNAQKAYHRARGELEDSRKKEVRLREKLKDVLEGNAGGGKETLAKARERIEALEREVDLLRVQNVALKRTDTGKENQADESASMGGHVLGTGTGIIDESRKLQHDKWEQDKKLQKRYVRHMVIVLAFAVTSHDIHLFVRRAGWACWRSGWRRR